MFGPGDPFPPVSVLTASNPDYAIDSTAGRYVVLTFIASGSLAGAPEYLAALYGSGTLFDDAKACCFIVTNDAADARAGLLRDRMPGIRVAWDLDYKLARLCGTLEEQSQEAVRFRLITLVLDPGQRVIEVIPVTDLATHFTAVRAAVEALPDPMQATDGWAPVLMVPGLLEPDLCREFIGYAERLGLEDSGYMTTDKATGQTVGVIDHRHKRRFDCTVEDEALRTALQARVVRRLAPAMKRAFQFEPTRMERYLVACYEGAAEGGGGWFRPHKDNTTKGTAHRRFAITIALNDDYEGGGLRFPEFGPRVYNAPVGGAVVFSCSLLHEAMPVTSGRRLCLLPFVYDEAAAQVRLENARYFADQEVARNVVASVLDQPVEEVAAEFTASKAKPRRKVKTKTGRTARAA